MEGDSDTVEFVLVKLAEALVLFPLGVGVDDRELELLDREIPLEAAVVELFFNVVAIPLDELELRLPAISSPLEKVGRPVWDDEDVVSDVMETLGVLNDEDELVRLSVVDVTPVVVELSVGRIDEDMLCDGAGTPVIKGAEYDTPDESAKYVVEFSECEICAMLLVSEDGAEVVDPGVLGAITLLQEDTNFRS